MAEKFTTFDPAAHLTDPAAAAAFINDALASGDAGYIARAVGIVARARGMSDLARDTGLSREQLYRSFSEHGNPTLKSLLAVLRELGVEFVARRHR